MCQSNKSKEEEDLKAQNDGEQEDAIDVRHIESATQAANDGEATDEDGEQHAGELRHQVLHQQVDRPCGVHQETGEDDKVGEEAIG